MPAKMLSYTELLTECHRLQAEVGRLRLELQEVKEQSARDSGNLHLALKLLKLKGDA